MAAFEQFFRLMGIDSINLSKSEILILEADLFIRICEELKEIFRKKYKNYFHLMKFTIEKENHMLETNFVRFILEDILSTGEYTPEGIALYADTHEDIVNEIAAGINIKPLATFQRKIIELHRSVRRDLYMAIGKKISTHYLPAV